MFNNGKNRGSPLQKLSHTNFTRFGVKNTKELKNRDLRKSKASGNSSKRGSKRSSNSKQELRNGLST